MLQTTYNHCQFVTTALPLYRFANWSWLCRWSLSEDGGRKSRSSFIICWGAPAGQTFRAWDNEVHAVTSCLSACATRWPRVYCVLRVLPVLPSASPGSTRTQLGPEWYTRQLVKRGCSRLLYIDPHWPAWSTRGVLVYSTGLTRSLREVHEVASWDAGSTQGDPVYSRPQDVLFSRPDSFLLSPLDPPPKKVAL